MCTTVCPLHLFLRDFENQRSDILRKTEPRSETDTSSVPDFRDGSKLKYFEATPALSPTVSHQLVLCSLAMGDFTGAFQKQPLCDFFDMTIYFAAHSIFLTFRSKQQPVESDWLIAESSIYLFLLHCIDQNLNEINLFVEETFFF